MLMTIDVSLEEIADSMHSGDVEQFIINLEKKAQEWEITENLALHFCRELKKFYEEYPQEGTFEEFLKRI